MNRLIILLLMLPLISCGQETTQSKFWKGYGVTDNSGNPLSKKVQQVLYLDNEQLHRLDITELLNMETGEIELKTTIDSFAISSSSDKNILLLQNEDKNLQLERVSANTIHLIDGDYHFPFKSLSDANKVDEELLKQQLHNHTYYEVNDDKQGLKDRLLMTPQKNGKIKYSNEYGSSNWESDYALINFKGYLVIKGISSPILLLNELRTEGIAITQLDYRYDAKNIEWKIYSAQEQEKHLRSDDNNKEYTIEYKTTEECLGGLTDKQLNMQLTTTTNIASGEAITTEVQHWYDGSWVLMGGLDFDGFAKVTLKELLAVDESVCFIANMPNGFYATRNIKGEEWKVYLHEERVKTDSSMITKKAFPHDNSYRVFNELKNADKTYYTQYYLDTKVIREKGTYLKGKEIGVWEFYDENGNLIRTENKEE